MNIYLVYKHTSPSGKSYIGITKNYDQRCNNHKNIHSPCTAFSNAIKKYGWDSFMHEIVAEGLTIEEANTLETQTIVECNTLAPFGYNLTTGGGIKVVSDLTRSRLSQSRKGRVTESHKLIISLTHKNKTVTDETKQKQRNARLGQHATEETKQKLSAIRKGRVMTNAHKNKIAKRYIVTDPFGIEMCIINMDQFCRDNNLRSSAMCDVASGRGLSYKGWKCSRI
jgi:group I intron endonuclease